MPATTKPTPPAERTSRATDRGVKTPTGELDNARGIRQFVAGTGGAGNYSFGATRPNSEVRYNATPGVLKFTLYADHYDWQFIPTSGSFTDTGSGSCH